ncbi:hypothetical protein F4820DRAFT_429228 [Hypoxylon rubiginosum]|uniref:Uncharacterized protein n=1 Tax=Hypoxylon rubiginosum TaxID=110542 RepID=A0ACB9YTT8_9PEZI|nr:hypothetical protein F4820DRAFT_429228 [Hypoxylon rubiginosum]
MDYASVILNVVLIDIIAIEMAKWIGNKLSGVLGVSNDDIDTLKPINSYGVDSRVSIELRNWFEKELGIRISIFELLGTSNIADISQIAATRTRFHEEE